MEILQNLEHDGKLRVDNIRDIFKLIECQTPGFREHLIEAAHNDVGYEIRRGERHSCVPRRIITLNIKR